MAKRRIGPFEIESKLGVGGMGIVYLATYLKTGQKVALKVLAPAMSGNEKVLSRFEREMEILQRLRHKHIVRYFWGGTIKGQHLYAMEIMDGGSLEDQLKRKGRLSWEQTVDCARHICKGLEHAHNAGIVHRDLKPANLFLSKKGYLKLGDFGIARDNQATALTAAGSTVGTYAYMAPEQITGKSPITRKTDLYALGCVMYELLTGRTPFQAETMVEMLQQHLQDEPQRISTSAIECPVWLESLVMKLLEKEPEDRYFDALAVQVALDDVVEKVTRQQSVAKQTLEGGTKATAQEGKELQNALGKKKKKKKKKGPFHEQVWFLSLCLALLIGGVTWAVWPLSEDQLYERAKVLMASKDIDDWRTAREKYIDPLRERFPEGKYQTEAGAWIDKIEMDFKETYIKNWAGKNMDRLSPEEKQYVQALRFEEFGDLALAGNIYQSVWLSLKKNPEKRPLFLLSERQLDQLVERRRAESKQAGHSVDIPSEEFVALQLEQAESLFYKDQQPKARAMWSKLIELYGDDPRYSAQTEKARDRLAGRTTETPVKTPDGDQ